MNGDVWLVLGNLLLAAFLGVVGQLIRIVAGLKKKSDAGDPFDAQQLWISLGIAVAVGAIAGVLSAIQGGDPHNKSTLLAILAAGYSGTDFIEAFMNKALPSSPLPQQPVSPPAQPLPPAKPQADTPPII